MGFWPDVKRGDKVQHHMVLENNVRHLINSLNGFGSGIGRSSGNGVVRIQIWNASNTVLAAGQPVAFDSTKGLCGDALPAVKVTDKEKPWGVCVQALPVNGMGDCIISGPAVVSLSGSSGDYAEPVVNGTGFARSETGTARVLFAGSKSIILLGGAGNVDTSYDGPFAVSIVKTSGKAIHVKQGPVNINGRIVYPYQDNLLDVTSITAGTHTVWLRIVNSGETIATSVIVSLDLTSADMLFDFLIAEWNAETDEIRQIWNSSQICSIYAEVVLL